MSEGIQITIPDFEDDDVRTGVTTPFGRSPFGFGGGGGGSGFGSSGFGNAGFGNSGFGNAGFGPSGLDSPAMATPISAFQSAEKSYFSHTRGDSSASIDSEGSATTRYTSKPSTPFTHSAHPSITTPTTTGFTKKPSFASIRNAFKSGNKSNDPPPVPSLAHAPYPVLKSPFNRSTSSINHPGATNRAMAGTPTGPGPSTFGRPPTPGANETRFPRGTQSMKPKGHSYSKSSGSVLQVSDGSDHGHSFGSSPPPLPRMPNAFGHVPRDEPFSAVDLDEDRVIMDPKTPADYALHAVFIRFAACAEGRIEVFLRQSMDTEPLLTKSMGPGVDQKFDDTMESLGIIGQKNEKNAKKVVDSIFRWRRSQNEPPSSEMIQMHVNQTSGSAVRQQDIPSILDERKSLASIHIMCRALIALLKRAFKGGFDEVARQLEGMTFEQFRNPDRKLLNQSANHRINLDLYAAVLGHISSFRFEDVTDLFVSELRPLEMGQVPKDLGMKYENLLRGMKYIRLDVNFSEDVEDARGEFMQHVAKAFVQTHGFGLKIAFSQTLVDVLHPFAKAATAEANMPQWAKAIEIIYPKAKEMMAKPRYWTSAFPLVIASLCLAPQSYFQKHWQSCFESAAAKMKDKEKQHRIITMNGLLRLIWTYIYKWPDQPSTMATKLETCLKVFFPPNKTTIFPLDEHLEMLICIIHFILSRQPDYGKELCLELLGESALNNVQKAGNIAPYLAPERTAIAINALLLTLRNTEKEITRPSWPSSSDFTILPSKEDYPNSADYLPPTLLKPGMLDFANRCSRSLATITMFCENTVGHMSLFDDQWSPARLNPAYDESNNYVFRYHPDNITVAYPGHLTPHITLLQTAFSSWPRCLHSSIVLHDAVDMLLWGVIHVDPGVADAASLALKRFINDDANAILVVSSFNQFLFDPSRICQDSSFRLQVEYTPLLALWFDIVADWINHIVQRGIPHSALSSQTIATCLEVEAAALILLSHVKVNIFTCGVKVVRLLGTVNDHISKSGGSDALPILAIVDKLQHKDADDAFLDGFDDLLDKSEQSRLDQWRKFTGDEVYLRIADGVNEKDRKIWRYVFSSLLQSFFKISCRSLATSREAIVAAVSRYHPCISYLAGLSSRVPPGLIAKNSPDRDGYKLLAENKPLIDQWHVWVKILSSTAAPPDLSRPALTQLGRDHARAPSDANFEKERLSTTRGLFRYLTPFLDSEYTLFRDAAVLCISSFPANAYPQLLEDLSLLAGRQFYDDQRNKLVTTPAFEQSVSPAMERSRSGSAALISERNRRQERLHSAVARIYCITAHLLDEQRSSGRQAALANILKFVRHTQNFLTSPDNRENPSLHRLRRYLCGTVERLFDGLATLKDSDRFIPPHMHLNLYRLCEEWCQLGPQSDAAKKRQASMQRIVESRDGDNREHAQRFRHECVALSQATVGALTSLCLKAFSPPDQAATSPTERSPPEFMRPLTVNSVLERLSAIMASSHPSNPVKGKATLESLLMHPDVPYELVQDSLRRAIMVVEKSGSSNQPFFEAISNIVIHEHHNFTFAQIVCLGLTNLRHPSAQVRSLAFGMLEAIHQQDSGLLTMSTYEPTVVSHASTTYIHAHRLIADFLAGEHPYQAISILAQLGNWLPQLPPEAYDTNVILLLLQMLESWIPNINLMTDDKSALSKEGLSSLYHLTSLTLRHGQTHAEQILVLWTKLVDAPQQSNGHATVRFLLEQAHKVGNTSFITCASNIVGSLCQTHIARAIFEELCSVILPTHMLPTIDHKLSFPEAQDMRLWEDLDALFADQPRLSLGTAQFAWLFLADAALQRYWEMKEQLPILLHSIFIHLDHRHAFIRQRAHSMLFQLLRSWMAGYDELPDRSTNRARSALKESLNSFEKEADGMYWTEEDSGDEAVPKMKALSARILSFLEPLAPFLLSQWGSLALHWGTSCAIRGIAFRSLQTFRALMPRVKKVDFAMLLGRLSNTVASVEENIQSFTSEIFSTINAVAAFNDLNKTILPQVFWCAAASLSTTVESEFAQILQLFDCILSKVDLDDATAVEELLAHRPSEWRDSPYLQPPLLKGLRSSTTSMSTMAILQKFAGVQDGHLIDATERRLRDLYVVSLPWCLHAWDRPLDDPIRTFAEDIAKLAAKEEKMSIHRVLSSFAFNRFRTKEDFLKEAEKSLREHYGTQHWSDMVTLILGLVLNNERWLRVYAMEVLKLLLSNRAHPLELLGSELLMPLLRLLETDLAAQALDVLEDPTKMSTAGPAAKHVLRMSMHTAMLTKASSDSESKATIFGVPEESGWSIAQADKLREICRANVVAVFDTCSVPTRPSRIEFEPEVEGLASIKTPLADDLGGLVRNLHELTDFFDPNLSRNNPTSVPTRRLEARVAAILAKSTAPDSVTDTPQTPFIDVFRISGIDDSNDLDEYSDSDSDTDAFVFDSITTPIRNTPQPHLNGVRYH